MKIAFWLIIVFITIPSLILCNSIDENNNKHKSNKNSNSHYQDLLEEIKNNGAYLSIAASHVSLLAYYYKASLIKRLIRIHVHYQCPTGMIIEKNDYITIMMVMRQHHSVTADMLQMPFITWLKPSNFGIIK